MGVHGLWKLLESTGKPVPVETLENKVLAVDVSIWLHQAARGFQDARGQSLPNAHLLGLFHRLCKLLFWRVRPVFVFDGGAPLLKQQTVAARRRRREGHRERADRLRRRLLELHLKKHAVREALARRRLRAVAGDPTSDAAPSPPPPTPLRLPGTRLEADDMFHLPPVPSPSPGDRSEDEDEPMSRGVPGFAGDGRGSSSSDEEEEAAGGVTVSGRRWRLPGHLDLHTVNVRSADFLALPIDVRHDILSELKETRKQSSWGRLHEMPRESNDFSSYQMERLLKRRSVQESLEATEREMGGRSLSLNEMEKFMMEAGALDAAAAAAAGAVGPGQRIAADELTRFIYVTKTGASAVAKEIVAPTLEANADDSKMSDSSVDKEKTEETSLPQENVKLDQVSKATFISLDIEEDNVKESHDDDISECIPEIYLSHNSIHSTTELESKRLQIAQNFIFENSGLSQNQILAVIKDHTKLSRSKPPKLCIDEPSTSKAFTCENIEKSSPGKEIKSSSVLKEIALKTDDKTSIRDVVTNFFSERNKISQDIPHKGKKISHNLEEGMIIRDGAICLADKQNVQIESDCAFEEEASNDLKCSNLIHSHSVFNEQNKDCKSPFTKVEYQISRNSMFKQKQLTQISERDVSSAIATDSLHESEIDGDSCISEDDFVEVDSNVPEKIPDSVQYAQKNCLEVVIKPVVTDFEDIFADVFGSSCLQTQKCNSQINIKQMMEPVKIQNVAISYQNELENSGGIANLKETDLPLKDFENARVKTDSTDPSCVPNNENINLTYDGSSDDVQLVSELEDTSFQNANTKPPVKLSDEQLEEMQGSLQEEGKRLEQVQAKDERLAATITEQMITEAQELLRLFGVPYIVAPMEAEAQCAFLDHASLTDGTITDDSDIWLFGGQKVYKNFFDQKKHVLQFRDIDIENSFKLSRSQLVLLALLVGSDYTTGLTGVGPVTALEILAAFPPSCRNGPPEQLLEGLQKFREWYMSEKRIDQKKLRNKLKNVDISREFPSSSVVEAYLFPQVDESMEKFTWSSPDVEAIKEFATIKFGWPSSKTIEILQPILKKLNIKISQLSIDSYFQPKPRLPPVDSSLSKRVQIAIDKIGAAQENVSEDEPSSSKKLKIDLSSEDRKKKDTNDVHSKIANKVSTKIIDCKSKVKGSNIGNSNKNKMIQTAAAHSNVSLNSKTKQKKTETSLGAGCSKEFILQREKDKLNLFKNKLKAIEVFRKSTRGLDKTKRDKKEKRKVLKEANLSESDSSSD